MLREYWIRSGVNLLSVAIISRVRDGHPRRVFFFCPGLLATKAEKDYLFVRIGRIIADDEESACVLLDYHGHGDSTGTSADIRFARMVADVFIVVRKVTKYWPLATKYLVGYGLGARITLLVAASCGAAGVVLLSPVLVLPWTTPDDTPTSWRIRSPGALHPAWTFWDTEQRRSLFERLGAEVELGDGPPFNLGFFGDSLLYEDGEALIAEFKGAVLLIPDQADQSEHVRTLQNVFHISGDSVRDCAVPTRSPVAAKQVSEQVASWCRSHTLL